MYLHSRVDGTVKESMRATRAATKTVFKTATKFNGNYLSSPFYKVMLLWNDLSSGQQRTDKVLQFVNGITKLFTGYREIL